MTDAPITSEPTPAELLVIPSFPRISQANRQRMQQAFLDALRKGWLIVPGRLSADRRHDLEMAWEAHCKQQRHIAVVVRGSGKTPRVRLDMPAGWRIPEMGKHRLFAVLQAACPYKHRQVSIAEHRARGKIAREDIDLVCATIRDIALEHQEAERP